MSKFVNCVSAWVTGQMRENHAICVRLGNPAARADSLAKDLADGTIDVFLGNVKKMNSGNAIQANTIDDCSGEADIADFWN